jgi:acetyl esterase/lipase
MQVFTQKLETPDGSEASLDGYVINDSPEMDAARRRPAVLIFPGGGIKKIAEREAEPVALRMLAYGYNAFVLRYSTEPSRFPSQLIEAAEAVALIRRNAGKWNTDQQAVVTLGFSIGGHIAGMLATQPDAPELAAAGYKPEEIRPNAAAFGYTVFDGGQFTHKLSMQRLLGAEKAADPVWQDRFSLQKHVRPGAPAMFIWNTATDTVAPPVASILMAGACLEARVPVELHMFSQGPHSLSLGTKETQSATDPDLGSEPAVQPWTSLFHAWMGRLFPAEDFDR